MTDVSGIPNMGFGGGGYFGGIPNQQPAMSADQINASMWGRFSPAQAQAPLQQNFANFGVQPAYYAGLGAAYGRQTGGFGMMPGGAAAPAGRVGTIGNPGTSNPGYLTSPSASVFNRGATPFQSYGLAGGGGAGLFSPPRYPSGTVSRGPDLPNISPAQNPFINYTPPAMSSAARSPFTSMSFGGNRDYLASLLSRNASPPAPDLRLGMGKADRLPLFAGGLKMQGGDRFGAFNPYSLNPNAMRAPATAFARTPSGGGGIGSDMLRGGQNALYAQPWHSMIPSGTPNTSEIIKQINYTAGRGRYDPAALAGVINTESRWNPATATGSYRGATQMGPNTFSEAGGRLGGMNFNQYARAPLERQIPVYGDWLSHYGRAPNTAANFAGSGALRGYPVSTQAAFLQGTQFSPNAGLPGTTNWPAAFAQGNWGMSTSPNNPRTGLPAPQADFLSYARGLPPTMSSMNAYYGRTIPR